MLQCLCIKTETNRTQCESSLVSLSFKGEGYYRYTTYCITRGCGRSVVLCDIFCCYDLNPSFYKREVLL